MIKLVYRKPRLFKYCTQSTFGDIISGMIGYDRPSVRTGIIPDFVASFCMPVKNKSCFSKFANYVGWFQHREAAHFSTGTGMFISSLKLGLAPMGRFSGSGSPCSMHDSMIFRATSSAISIVSAIVLPWAIRPCNTGLVARYSPSSKYSMDIGMRYSATGIYRYFKKTYLNKRIYSIGYETCQC